LAVIKLKIHKAYIIVPTSQGEDAATTRLISDTVDIAEVPSIMQAMGFYPTEREIEDMLNEIKFSSLAKGELVESISFADLIKLYVNHRPVSEMTEGDLMKALSYAIRAEPGNAIQYNLKRKINSSDQVSKIGLIALVQQYGESMSKADFELAFRALLVNDSNYNGILPDQFTGKEFVEDILGFQPTLPPLPGDRIAKAADGNAAAGIFKGLNIGDTRESTPMESERGVSRG
jgi:Ca2+-binding EF-hand superfamily protein